MDHSSNQHHLLRFLSLSILLLVASVTVMAQPKDPGADQFAGHYKGTVKRASGQTDLTLDVKWADGKFSGRALAADGEYPISSGQIAGGKLTLKFGAPAEGASLTLQKIEDKLTGDWVRGAEKGTVELKKTPVEAVNAESINGEWDAVADAQGQPFPFTLTLKIDGEKVTGSSTSQLGTSPITSGTWKDGKLAVVMEGGAGQIALMATMIEGKLSGDYDFAGQLSGKWVAIKKK
jgi:hypothetical protein